MALYRDDGATLNDLREAVNSLEESARIARRVFGGAHPITKGMEEALRRARAALRAREAPDDETVDVSAQELDTAQVTTTKKRKLCDTGEKTSDGEQSLPRVSALYDADDIE